MKKCPATIPIQLTYWAIFFLILTLWLFGLPALAQVNSSGLIGRWTFDEGSGGTAGDSSGNSNPGTLVNGPLWTAGQVGGALNFDGLDDFLNIGADTIFNFSRGEPFTVSAWIRATASGYHSIAARQTAGTLIGWHIYKDDLGRLGFDFGNGSASQIMVRRGTSGNLNNGLWHQVAAVYSGSGSASGASLYVDGVLATNSVVSDTCLAACDPGLSLAANTFIGNRGESDFEFSGAIDDVLIYNRALTNSEVQNIFNLGSSPPPLPPPAPGPLPPPAGEPAPPAGEPAPPPPPINIITGNAPTATSTGSATISWSTPPELETNQGYLIRISSEQGGMTRNIAVSNQTREIEVPNLFPGDYSVEIYAFKDGTLAPVGETNTTVNVEPMPKPFGLFKIIMAVILAAITTTVIVLWRRKRAQF